MNAIQSQYIFDLMTELREKIFRRIKPAENKSTVKV